MTKPFTSFRSLPSVDALPGCSWWGMRLTWCQLFGDLDHKGLAAHLGFQPLQQLAEHAASIGRVELHGLAVDLGLRDMAWLATMIDLANGDDEDIARGGVHQVMAHTANHRRGRRHCRHGSLPGQGGKNARRRLILGGDLGE